MANPPGAMRPPPASRPPSRPPSMEPPPPVEQAQVPPPPENTWPCGCAYPGAHHTDCMWSLWEQMSANYMQTKALMGKFMNQVDSLQTSAKAKVECECPSSCHGRDLGQAMGLQQMQGVTVPWLQPPSNTGGTVRGPPERLPDAGGYVSESRKLVEEQQRIKKTWAQFLNIFDIALDMANDVSKDRWEATRRRKERERLERQERHEEERRQRQERRDKCAEERSQSRDEDGEEEQKDGDEKKKAAEKPEPKKTEAKSPPATPPKQTSPKVSVVEEEASPPKEEPPEEDPQPEPAQEAEGGEVAEEPAAELPE